MNKNYNTFPERKQWLGHDLAEKWRLRVRRVGTADGGRSLAFVALSLFSAKAKLAEKSKAKLSRVCRSLPCFLPMQIRKTVAGDHRAVRNDAHM